MSEMIAERVTEFRVLLNETDAEQGERPKDDSPLDSPEAKGMHRELMASFMLEIGRQSASRRRRARAEDYYHNIQFTEAEKDVIEARGQTATQLNVMAPAINWMLGTERRNRADGKVLPRTKDGRRDADHKTQLLKYVDDCCYAEMKKSAAFADAVITGMGWLETGVRDNEAGGEPVFTGHVAWRQMIHDSFATESDLSDGRYLFRAKWTDVNIATAMFPDRKHIIRAASMRDSGAMISGGLDGWGDEVMDAAEIYAEDNAEYSFEVAEAMRPRVRLIEAWTRRPAMTDCMIGGMFDGEIFDPYSMGHVQEIIIGKSRVKKKLRNRMQVHIMTSAGLLRSQNSPYRHNKFPFTPIIANKRASDNMPYGLAETMVDLQDDINKRFIKAQYILNTNKVMAERDGIEDEDEFLEEVVRPDGVIWYKDGKKPDINADKELSAGHVQMMSTSIDMIQQLSGVTDESMGKTTNATSGKAIIARQQQGAMTTAHYYDNLRHALQIHGEKQLCVIEQFMDREKQFRIATPRGGVDFRTVNDPADPTTNITRFKGAFAMGEEDWKASNRQASADAFANVMAQIAPAAPELMVSVIDILVEMMDVPYGEEIVARFRDQFGIDDPDEDPENPSPKAQERAAAKKAASDSATAAEKAAKDAAEAETAKQRAAAREAGARAIKAEIEAQTARVGLHRSASELATTLHTNRATVGAADKLVEDAINAVNGLMASGDAADEADMMPPPPPPAAPAMAPAL